ncbi:MAG: hypothetical protein EBY20_02615 [Alphaproteobacteria bacterium]|uniref:Uncharacterized protein n=1 Tax=viral metagenome TaxID=1070528 RepID=A0A6C0HSY2_9ZZZZ|nr:hypothetical protein [Alphaproteobacteria bacterium]
MSDDDWGFFIDLEQDPVKKDKQQSKKEKEKEKDKQQPKKEKYKIYSNNLTVIYEEDIWYQRDENDDTDYKKGTETWECSEEKEKEKKTTIGGCVDKYSIIIYCVICASFISWSVLA